LITGKADNDLNLLVANTNTGAKMPEARDEKPVARNMQL
jgi:hypothetical protein